MFGYVRPAMGRLSQEDQCRYRALYCGLCHTLGDRCGIASRFILNYDFTFLAALLTSAVDCRSRRCIASPVKRQEVICTNPSLELAADCSVIFTYYKVLDEIADGSFARRQVGRAAQVALRIAYRKAAARHPSFDEAAREELKRLSRLEEARCTSLDEPADTFARLLQSVTLELNGELEKRILAQFLYHLGRWIYLVDALDDWKDDLKTGNYNPIITRFSIEEKELPAEVKRRIASTLDASIRQMATSYELWDFGPWSNVIEAAVYDGLYCVGHAVLEGTFHAADQKAFFRGKKEHL